MYISRLTKICDRIIEIGILLIIGLCPIYFNIKTFSVFQIDRMVLFQVLTEIIFFFFILKILITKRLVIPRNIAPLILGGLFVAILGLASIFSESPWLSFWGSYMRKMGWIIWLHYFLFFIVFVFNIQSETKIKHLLVSSIVVLYGLLQLVHLDPFLWKESVPQTGRIFSTFGQPNFLGTWFLFVIPVAIYSLFLFKKFLARFFIVLLLGGLVSSLVFTLSRGAWLGTLVGIVFFFLVYSFARKKKKMTLAITLIVVLMLILGIFVNLFDILPKESDSLIWLRIRSLATFSGATSILRLKIWQAGLDIIKEKPILGYGLETQTFNFIRYYEPSWAIYEKINICPDRAHNEFLDLLLTSGILGLISFLILIGYFFWQGLKKLITRYSLLTILLLSGLLAVLVSHQFSFPVTVTGLYFWLFLGLLTVNSWSDGERREIKLVVSPWFTKSVIIGLAILVGLTVWYVNIRLVVADWHFRETQLIVNRQDWSKVIRGYELALKYNPEEPYYRRELASDLLNYVAKAQNKKDKIKILDFAYDSINEIPFAGKDFTTLARRARVLTFYGLYVDEKHFQGAEENYKGLSELSPQMARVYIDWAEMYLMKKDFSKARNLYYQAISLYPDINHPYMNQEHRYFVAKEMAVAYKGLGQAQLNLGHYGQAIEAFSKVIKLKPRDVVIHKFIADTYYLRGDLDKALEENLRGLMLNPKDSQWHFGAAILYKEKGDLEQAKKYAQQALELAPDNKDIQDFLTKLKYE
jgi:O-antigen ligase/tetratricopeptide (TPR) repeat protein